MKSLSLTHLFFAELRHRFSSALIAILAVWIASACICSALISLDGFDRETQQNMDALQERARTRMEDLENETRMFAKSLGFNIFVYHGEQDFNQFDATDVGEYFLREDQADKLAHSRFEYLNHMLPILRERYEWKEYGGMIIIAGIKGEIYIKSKWQKPMEVEIKPGEVHLGYSLAKKMSLKVGDQVHLGEKTFRVTVVREILGSKDDITLFMNLGEAQTLLDRPGLISGILALSCNCAAGDVDPIRRALQRIIPEAEVVEFSIRAKARARAREAIGKAAQAELHDLKTSRASFRYTLAQFSLLFSYCLSIACAMLLFFLYHHNMKERRSEFAILKTLGVRSMAIYGICFSKAVGLALLGSGLGIMTGCALSIFVFDIQGIVWTSFEGLFSYIAIGSLGMGIVASWIPVRSALAESPGSILNGDG